MIAQRINQKSVHHGVAWITRAATRVAYLVVCNA